MNYYPWVNKIDKTFAWLSEKLPDEIRENDYKLVFGSSVKSWFPKEVTFDLSLNHGTVLTDYISNVHNVFIVSEKLQKILVNADENVESFPVKIRNHKKRIVNENYFLINFLGSIECVDKERSEFRNDAILKDQIGRFYKLVLDELKIPQSKNIFRLGEMKQLVIVNEQLAIEIVRTNNCTGLGLRKMERFGEEFRD